jgi:nucleoside-diphosphate-sugar epimerase
MSRVVVTGAAGMLGDWLVRRLQRDGRLVHGIDVRRDPAGEVVHAVADVRDEGAMARAVAGADAVVHCATALPSYPAKQIHPVVVDGTRTVLTAARAAGVGRVVHISTTSVYGLPQVVPTPEDHPLTPVDAYGTAKAAAEEICKSFRTDGVCVPILRPKTFLGPGRMGLFAMLFEWAEEGRNFPVLGRGDVKTQMCDVEDVVECVVAALTADPETANDTFNVAAAEFGTLREDFQAVLDAAGHGRRVVSIPAGPAVPVLRLLDRLGVSPVYRRLPHKLLADSYVSIDKARQRLGYQPKYSNQDTLLRTFRWWREQRPGANAATGRTSRHPWSQGVLRAAKVFF